MADETWCIKTPFTFGGNSGTLQLWAASNEAMLNIEAERLKVHIQNERKDSASSTTSSLGTAVSEWLSTLSHPRSDSVDSANTFQKTASLASMGSRTDSQAILRPLGIGSVNEMANVSGKDNGGNTQNPRSSQVFDFSFIPSLNDQRPSICIEPASVPRVISPMKILETKGIWTDSTPTPALIAPPVEQTTTTSTSTSTSSSTGLAASVAVAPPSHSAGHGAVHDTARRRTVPFLTSNFDSSQDEIQPEPIFSVHALPTESHEHHRSFELSGSSRPAPPHRARIQSSPAVLTDPTPTTATTSQPPAQTSIVYVPVPVMVPCGWPPQGAGPIASSTSQPQISVSAPPPFSTLPIPIQSQPGQGQLSPASPSFGLQPPLFPQQASFSMSPSTFSSSPLTQSLPVTVVSPSQHQQLLMHSQQQKQAPSPSAMAFPAPPTISVSVGGVGPPTHQQTPKLAESPSDNTTTSATPCGHYTQWKRLRVRKGINHFLCRQCGIKWKIPVATSPQGIADAYGSGPGPSATASHHPHPKAHPSPSNAGPQQMLVVSVGKPPAATMVGTTPVTIAPQEKVV